MKMKYKNVEISELLNLDNYKTFSDQETDQELIYFEDLLFVNKELKKHVDVNVILEKLKVKQQNRRERLNKINDLEIKKEELQQLEFEDVDKKTNLFVKVKHKLQMKLINFQLNLIKKKTDEKRIESNDNITLIYN